MDSINYGLTLKLCLVQHVVLVGVLLFEIKYVSNGLIIDVLDLEFSGKEM